jgi:hypothetical protein
LEEYRVDGFRFDLSKGLTQVDYGSDVGKWSQYDASRVKILKNYANVGWNAGGSDAYMIMEHFADNKEETELTDYGMMVWQNANYAFGQGLMGYASNNGISNTYYPKRGFKTPGGLVYAESHDEERNVYRGLNFGNKSGDYNTKNLTTTLRRAELMGVFLLGIPGPKMIWQFGEIGYDYSINDCGNGTVNNNCRLSNKPVRWDYLEDPRRLRLYNVYRSMIDLKKTQSVFQSSDVVVYDGNTKQVVMKDGDQKMLVIGNFDVTDQELYVDWPEANTYYEYFTGEVLNVKTTDLTLVLRPGEYRIYTTKKLSVPIGGYKPYTATRDILTQVVDFEVFPNPSLQGESSQIVYNLTEAATVSLDITDLSGRVVTSLTAGRQEVGSYQFDVSDNLPTGAYIVKLSIGGRSVARRLLKL